MPRRREGSDSNMQSPEEDFSSVLEESHKVLRHCFKEYKLDEIFLSFNGGKDCTVLLDITLEILQQLHGRSDIGKELKVVYIRTSSPFKELEDFVMQVEQHYGLELMVTEGEMKVTLQQILAQDSRLKACLMGTRRSDPYSEHMDFMQKTDPNWPEMMRVSPLLNWSYGQIWSYIHSRSVPYCSLYDRGYTSIGSTLNTWPNPALAYKDSSGSCAYRPAWLLTDGSLERAGRGTRQNAPSNGHDLCNGHTKSNSCCGENGL